MARKNSRVERRKTLRKYRENGSKSNGTRLAPIPIEATVVPKGRCFLRSRMGKLRFTRQQVDTALRHAQHTRVLRGNASKIEQRYYECDEPGGCGDFHLTSRESWTPKQ